MVRGDGHDHSRPAGADGTFLCLGPGWSTVSNTPFRKHKTWVHEGGISTPFIAHWPAGITPLDTPVENPHHVIDISPTLLEIASRASGPNKASESNSTDSVPPMPGRSFLSEFATHNSPVQTTKPEEEVRPLWWQHEGNRALRLGNLKIVAAGKEANWELYDLDRDRAETNNLALERPDELKRLVDLWQRMSEEFTKNAYKE